MDEFRPHYFDLAGVKFLSPSCLYLANQYYHINLFMLKMCILVGTCKCWHNIHAEGLDSHLSVIGLVKKKEPFFVFSQGSDLVNFVKNNL